MTIKKQRVPQFFEKNGRSLVHETGSRLYMVTVRALRDQLNCWISGQLRESRWSWKYHLKSHQNNKKVGIHLNCAFHLYTQTHLHDYKEEDKMKHLMENSTSGWAQH